MSITLIRSNSDGVVHGADNDKLTGCRKRLQTMSCTREGEMKDIVDLTCDRCKEYFAKKMIRESNREESRIAKEEKKRFLRAKKQGIVSEATYEEYVINRESEASARRDSRNITNSESLPLKADLPENNYPSYQNYNQQTVAQPSGYTQQPVQTPQYQAAAPETQQPQFASYQSASEQVVPSQAEAVPSPVQADEPKAVKPVPTNKMGIDDEFLAQFMVNKNEQDSPQIKTETKSVRPVSDIMSAAKSAANNILAELESDLESSSQSTKQVSSDASAFYSNQIPIVDPKSSTSSFQSITNEFGTFNMPQNTSEKSSTDINDFEIPEVPSLHSYSDQKTTDDSPYINELTASVQNTISSSDAINSFDSINHPNINTSIFDALDAVQASIGGFDSTESSFKHDDQTKTQISGFETISSVQPQMNGFDTVSPVQPQMNGFDTVSPVQPQMNGFDTVSPVQPQMNGFDTVSPVQPQMGGFDTVNPVQPQMGGFDTVSPVQPQMGGFDTVSPVQPQMGGFDTVSPVQPQMGGFNTVSPVQPQMGGFNTVSPVQPQMGGFDTVNPVQPQMGGFNTVSPVQPQMGGFNTVSPVQPQMGGFDTVSPVQPQMGGFDTVSPIQPQMGGFDTINPVQPQMGGFDTVSPVQPQMGGFDTVSPVQPQMGGFNTVSPVQPQMGGFDTISPVQPQMGGFDTVSPVQPKYKVVTPVQPSNEQHEFIMPPLQNGKSTYNNADTYSQNINTPLNPMSHNYSETVSQINKSNAKGKIIPAIANQNHSPMVDSIEDALKQLGAGDTQKKENGLVSDKEEIVPDFVQYVPSSSKILHTAPPINDYTASGPKKTMSPREAKKAAKIDAKFRKELMDRGYSQEEIKLQRRGK